jgi:cell division FtsZ-interacting protein ZapD
MSEPIIPSQAFVGLSGKSMDLLDIAQERNELRKNHFASNLKETTSNKQTAPLPPVDHAELDARIKQLKETMRSIPSELRKKLQEHAFNDEVNQALGSALGATAFVQVEDVSIQRYCEFICCVYYYYYHYY